VCTYWPEFAARGKETITVRQLLAHQVELLLSTSRSTEKLSPISTGARHGPSDPWAWRPGTRQAYHAISLGLYQGELIRRIDPHHRSLGQLFQDQNAAPLGLDVYIRLPEEIPNSRLAILDSSSVLERLRGFPIRLSLASLYLRSDDARSLRQENPTSVHGQGWK
jgi:CubicO group peptidase (beta-lactamase class C family)